MEQISTTIIGLGLIGGSIALDLQDGNFSTHVYGVESNPEYAKIATERGIVSQVLSMEEAFRKSDIIILATPLSAMMELLPVLLDQAIHHIIVDVCSTKSSLAELISRHRNRGRYVAAHPMSGTEYSGPNAALKGLFQKKINIICDAEKSDADALSKTVKLFQSLGMKTEYMNSKEHDIHAAYVSHISHISSFSLALTVLDIEDSNQQHIQRMAAGGFKSTVRLAKSSADTWTQILIDNDKNVLEAMAMHAEKMEKIRRAIEQQDTHVLKDLILKSNKIRPIIDNIL